MALEARIDNNEVFICPLRSSDTIRKFCYPQDCALGKSFDAGAGVTRWYCALNAPTDSEPNCYVERAE